MWLFLVRHGSPDYDKDCLTEEGKKQAAALAKRFARKGLDKIYASTMGRATETAKYTSDKLGLPIEGLDFAREDVTGREFYCGKNQEGKRCWCFWDKSILAQFKSEEVKKLGDKWYDSALFEDKMFKSGTLRVQKAVTEFMAELGYRRNEKNGFYKAEKHVYDRVALFAHGGFSMIFISCLLNMPYPEFCLRFQHVEVSTVTSFWLDDSGEDIVPIMYQYGNDSHLYKEDLLEGLEFITF